MAAHEAHGDRTTNAEAPSAVGATRPHLPDAHPSSLLELQAVGFESR
jgi:hypothetical protein